MFCYIIYVRFEENMVTYEWLKIFKQSQGSPSIILDILTYIVERPIPKDDYDIITKRMSKIDWSGDSFLLNPQAVIDNRHFFKEKELAEYVGLASFRNLAEYKTTGRKTLPVKECPVKLESIKDNRLLSIVNNQIYFKWEETTH